MRSLGNVEEGQRAFFTGSTKENIIKGSRVVLVENDRLHLLVRTLDRPQNFERLQVHYSHQPLGVSREKQFPVAGKCGNISGARQIRGLGVDLCPNLGYEVHQDRRSVKCAHHHLVAAAHIHS